MARDLSARCARRRLRPGRLAGCAPVLVLAAALAALQVASPCQDPALALRCPDLVMAAPSHLRAQRLPSGRQVLRMENQIVNIGAGPAEFFAERSGPRQMTARQVIADG